MCSYVLASISQANSKDLPLAMLAGKGVARANVEA